MCTSTLCGYARVRPEQREVMPLRTAGSRAAEWQGMPGGGCRSSNRHGCVPGRLCNVDRTKKARPEPGFAGENVRITCVFPDR